MWLLIHAGINVSKKGPLVDGAMGKFDQYQVTTTHNIMWTPHIVLRCTLVDQYMEIYGILHIYIRVLLVAFSILAQPCYWISISAILSDYAYSRITKALLLALSAAYLCLHQLCTGRIYICCHDDTMAWKHFPHCWPYVRRLHAPPMHFPLFVSYLPTSVVCRPALYVTSCGH